jgi:ribonuclease P protein component
MATSALDVNPGGTIAFPLRAVWRYNHGRNNGAKVQFLITIPKKRIRHAVDRVTARRRVREAYRLNRHLLDTLPSDIKIDIAFIYVAPTLQPYATIEAAVCKLLRRMTRNYSNTATTPDTNATHNS